MIGYHEFFNPVEVIAGVGSLKANLTRQLEKYNVKRLLLISNDPLNKSGVVDTIKEYIGGALEIAGIYINIKGNISLDTIDKIASIYRFNNCDGIVVVGGGVVIDTAKAVKFVLGQNVQSLIELRGYYSAHKGSSVPLIVVPVPCGNGSELSNQVVAKDDKNDKGKLQFVNNDLFPNVCIVDGGLMSLMDIKVVIYSLLEEMGNIIESMCSVKSVLLTNRYAKIALVKIMDCLARCLSMDATDEDRQNLMDAFVFAGVSASTNARGSAHSISNAISIYFGVPAGIGMASVLPYVLRANMQVCGERYAELLYYLVGVDKYATIAETDRAEEFVRSIEEMYATLKSKYSLEGIIDIGMKEESIPEIVEMCYFDCANLANPTVVTRAYIVKILTEMLEGEGYDKEVL